MPTFEDIKRLHEELHAQAREAFLARDRNEGKILEELKIALAKNTTRLRELFKKLSADLR